MSVSGTVELRIPAVGGRFVTVILDLSRPFDFASVRNATGARLAQTPAPLQSNALRNNATGASAPVSLPTGAQPSHWSLKGRLQPTGTKIKNTVREELLATREALASKAAQLADLDSVLAPVRIAQEAIRGAIHSTHEIRNDVIWINFRKESIAARRPLFAELDALSRKWGKEFNERKALYGEIKTLEREIDHLSRVVAKEGRRKANA